MCFRDIVRNSIHASEHDAVIFVGSGCTAAVHKIIHALNFSQPPVSTRDDSYLVLFYPPLSR